MTLRIRPLAGCVFFLAMAAPGHAEGICEAAKHLNSDAARVSGTIVEIQEDAAMLKLEDDCGSINVGIPASTEGELLLFLFACIEGGTAEATGSVTLGILQAERLLCK